MEKQYESPKDDPFCRVMGALGAVLVIAALVSFGLAACGDDTKSPASPATTPAVGTTAMVDHTTAMVDNTTAMVDGSTATTGG